MYEETFSDYVDARWDDDDFWEEIEGNPELARAVFWFLEADPRDIESYTDEEIVGIADGIVRYGR